MTDRSRAVLLFGLVVLALAGAAWFQTRRTPAQPLLLATQTASALDLAPSQPATVTPVPTLSPLRVYISGAVVDPDVYILQAGSIVKDALLAAGGAAPDADLDRINLAAALSDGQHVYIPRTGETVLPVAPEGQPESRSVPGATGGRININVATAAELETLPGIGPSLAGRIVAYREAHGPFVTPEDILEVSGIGPATLDEIRELITTN